jgi:hypothetical protein
LAEASIKTPKVPKPAASIRTQQASTRPPPPARPSSSSV